MDYYDLNKILEKLDVNDIRHFRIEYQEKDFIKSLEFHAISKEENK